MARYTGSRRRVLRRLGTDLSGLTPKSMQDRPYPPGMHGPTAFRRRRRASPYATHLLEKQKLRYYYGVTEAQLRRYARRAARQKGPTGENLLALLELRLDNVAFRLGLAHTIPAARQLVTHGHVRVNGRRVDIPSYQLSPGDVVHVRERSRDLLIVRTAAKQGPPLALPRWLERAPDGLGGRVLGPPSREEVPVPVRESLVVEFYAR